MSDLIDSRRSGSGSPLVLLHGLNGSWRVWDPVFDALAAHHDVFAATMAAHRGAPAVAAGPCGIGPLADEMEARLTAAGIERAHLVGNSLGGWLALELAARGRATSVVAFAPAGCWTKPGDLARVGRLLKIGRRAGMNPTVQRMLARPNTRRSVFRAVMERADLIPADDLAALLADLAACQLLPGLLASLRITGPVARLEVDAPVRLAWPVKDRTIPFERYGRPWLAVLPKAELVRLRGVGHMPMYDDPGLVVRTVREFTAKVDAAA
ncbi:MAG TPA: alpha/beta fold hydrolase [Sporichthyaceae bacterium]|jgi:pimeloyl-ACP methyl ester carboxylesterase|nr:alpha/beta fold hydrolase [Sporichthyaceae bacterium]